MGTSVALIFICNISQLYLVLNLNSGKEGFEIGCQATGVSEAMLVVGLATVRTAWHLCRGLYRDSLDTNDT